MFDAGWAGINWPKEFGGRGASLMEQLIWYEEYAKVGAPDVNTGFVGLKHAGPTLIACGTEAQKRFHLPKILGGDVVWCQGFSEPNAGSDLAALQTRAVIEGDELVVTGQKIWTSFGQIAEYQELLVRTDPDAPKHKGITWVICPMDAPGIEIRPIKTLAGNADFCEVFYDNVRIPLANVVGTYVFGLLGGRLRRKAVLAAIYLARTAAMALFVLLPLAPATLYVFAAAMGFLWLGTLPLTNGIVGQVFGVRHIGTLFGFVFFGHQVGSFLGVWLGGVVFVQTHSYDLVWLLAMALGVLAAALHWPIDDRTLARTTRTTRTLARGNA